MRFCAACITKGRAVERVEVRVLVHFFSFRFLSSYRIRYQKYNLYFLCSFCATTCPGFPAGKRAISDVESSYGSRS